MVPLSFPNPRNTLGYFAFSCSNTGNFAALILFTDTPILSTPSASASCRPNNGTGSQGTTAISVLTNLPDNGSVIEALTKPTTPRVSDVL